MDNPWPLFHLFLVFSNKRYNFYYKSMWKNVTSIQYSNSRPLEHESSSITTRPGSALTFLSLFVLPHCAFISPPSVRLFVPPPPSKSFFEDGISNRLLKRRCQNPCLPAHYKFHNIFDEINRIFFFVALTTYCLQSLHWHLAHLTVCRLLSSVSRLGKIFNGIG